MPATEISQIMDLMQESKALLMLALQHDPVCDSGVSRAFCRAAYGKGPRQHGEIARSGRVFAQREVSAERALVAEFAERQEAFVKEGILPTLASLSSGDYLQAALRLAKDATPKFSDAHHTVAQLWKIFVDGARRPTSEEAGLAIEKESLILCRFSASHSCVSWRGVGIQHFARSRAAWRGIAQAR